MALLNENNLAGEAGRRARFRVHHVGTKLNEAELHELEALAARRSQTQAELIRGLILREIEESKTRHRASAEMVEITACRGQTGVTDGRFTMGKPAQKSLRQAYSSGYGPSRSCEEIDAWHQYMNYYAVVKSNKLQA
jgi:hypothetical protein